MKVKNSKFSWLFGVAVITALAFWITVAYVAVHFVTKYW